MKHFVLAAVAAVALALCAGQVRANGFTTHPGHIGLSGGLTLNWGAFGWSHNPSPGYGYPPPSYGYQAPSYGYQAPMHYAPQMHYGPGCCGGY